MPELGWAPVATQFRRLQVCAQLENGLSRQAAEPAMACAQISVGDGKREGVETPQAECEVNTCMGRGQVSQGSQQGRKMLFFVHHVSASDNVWRPFARPQWLHVVPPHMLHHLSVRRALLDSMRDRREISAVRDGSREGRCHVWNLPSSNSGTRRKLVLLSAVVRRHHFCNGTPHGHLLQAAVINISLPELLLRNTGRKYAWTLLGTPMQSQEKAEVCSPMQLQGKAEVCSACFLRQQGFAGCRSGEEIRRKISFQGAHGYQRTRLAAVPRRAAIEVHVLERERSDMSKVCCHNVCARLRQCYSHHPCIVNRASQQRLHLQDIMQIACNISHQRTRPLYRQWCYSHQDYFLVLLCRV